jgi:SPOR domain
MMRKLIFILVILGFSSLIVRSQSYYTTSDLFKSTDPNSQSGRLTIYQDPALDTLIGRYIMENKNLEEKNGFTGVEGFRIQIYNSSDRNAKVESAKVRQEFMNQFPDVVSYLLFAEPAWYKVRVGNFRSRTEATRLFLIISKKFPNADLVPDIINLPDLNIK